VVSKTSLIARDSGNVDCTTVADSMEVIGDTSSPGASKRFDLRANEVFDRFLLPHFASSSRFRMDNVLTSSSDNSNSFFIARMLELSTIFCSDSMIGLKCLHRDIILDLTGLIAMLLADRFPRFLNLPRDLLTLANIIVLSHVDKVSLTRVSPRWSIDNDRFTVSQTLNSFLYRLLVSELSLSIIMNPYLRC